MNIMFEYWALDGNCPFSACLFMSSIKMASWPCWTRSAWGRGRSPTRPSWTNWTPSAPSTSTLRVASARIQSSSPTTACRTAASASSTTPARCWTRVVRCMRNKSTKRRSLYSIFSSLSPVRVKVLYRVEGFVDKNNDLLYRDLSQAMYKATQSLIKQLFPEGNPAKVNLKRPPTAGSQFKASVGTLMRNLQTKNPNYIRCVHTECLSVNSLPFQDTRSIVVFVWGFFLASDVFKCLVNWL